MNSKIIHMTKLLIYISPIIFMMIAASCEEEEQPYISNEDALYIGYWKDRGSTDSTFLFERINELAKDTYAFGILSDGTFVENKNAGFCGTPPITYAEYAGSWLELSTDSLLINTKYWGGNMSFYLIIKSVSEKKLEAKIHYLELEVP